MDRRNFVKATAASAGTFIMGAALADDHKHHEHGKKIEIKDGISKKSAKKLIETTEDCIEKGRACLNHCTRELAKGNTMMAKCNSTIQDMLAACEALNTLAHSNTLNKAAFKKFAASCSEICKICHDECKKHAKMHDECEECMESCKDCIEACKDIA